MEKLERYLNQALHGIAGPRALRAHLRRELQEHLLDAIAQHQAAGLSEDDALARALEDFGGPDQVRSELEATHGHRLMTVVLDKALQWKENTMKARWLWTSAALTTLLLTIALELLLIVGVVIFLFPKFHELINVGILVDGPAQGIVQWSLNYLGTAAFILHNILWILIPLALLWFLFEWRVRTENKSFIRLSFLGLVSVGLGIAAIFTTAAISLPPFVVLSYNATSEGSEQFVTKRLTTFDGALAQIDQSTSAADWLRVQEYADRLVKYEFTYPGLSFPVNTPAVLLLSRHRQELVKLHHNIRDTRNVILDLQTAAATKDPTLIKETLQKLHAAYDPLRQFATPDTLPAAEP